MNLHPLLLEGFWAAMSHPAGFPYHPKSEVLGRESKGLRFADKSHPPPTPRYFPAVTTASANHNRVAVQGCMAGGTQNALEASPLPQKHKQFYKKPHIVTQARRTSWRK